MLPSGRTGRQSGILHRAADVVCVRAGWIEEGVSGVSFLCGRKRQTLATKSKPTVNRKQVRRKFIGGKLAMFAPCATMRRNAQESSCCLLRISGKLSVFCPSFGPGLPSAREANGKKCRGVLQNLRVVWTSRVIISEGLYDRTSCESLTPCGNAQRESAMEIVAGSQRYEGELSAGCTAVRLHKF